MIPWLLNEQNRKFVIKDKTSYVFLKKNK